MDEMLVLLNSRAKEAAGARARVASALQLAGLSAQVRQVTPDELPRVAAEIVGSGVKWVVAAGGDGTVGAVAQAIAGRDIALGILPLGTLNHFARDLGIPQDLAAAARVLAGRKDRRIDLGEVNGHFFLNNCSIGLYPRMVRRREGQRQRLGRGKWFAMLLAAVSIFRRYPLVHVTLQTPGRTLRCTSPLVFVGNNRYETSLLDLGHRTRLDAGELWVYLATAPGRLDLLRLIVRTLLGRLEQAKDFQTMPAEHLAVETRKRHLRVALDGEVLRLRPPLNFRIRPGALRVVAP